MKNLRPETLGMLQRIEALSGRPVEFKPDSSLTLRATLQLARNGAPSHVLRYRPTNEPLDYWVAYQAGYLLRLLELPPAERFDFRRHGHRARPGGGTARHRTAAGRWRPVDPPQFAEMTAHWALLNLRSYAIGMRIDQWLADDHPELRSLQAAGIRSMQQENLQLLSKRMGGMSIPVPLLGPVAAYALFADRLLGQTSYAIPYRAAGVLDLGAELLAILDKLPWSRPRPRPGGRLGSSDRHDGLVRLDPLQALSPMATEFTIPLHRFDTNLLPPMRARWVPTRSRPPSCCTSPPSTRRRARRRW
jgi:hypothetical protein